MKEKLVFQIFFSIEEVLTVEDSNNSFKKNSNVPKFIIQLNKTNFTDVFVQM